MISQNKTICKISILVVLLTFVIQSDLFGLTLTVQEPDGTPVNGYSWTVQEDNTNQPSPPGIGVANSLAVDIHKSHALVVATGHSDTSVTSITLPGDKPYVVSVLPYAGHGMSGKIVAAGQTEVTVNVNPFPTLTAQITVLAFHDNHSINNAPDAAEEGLQGFSVVIADMAGQQMKDAFDNMLGTTYQQNPDGSFVLIDGAPVVDQLGDGNILTDINGEAKIKFLAPGKYGVQIIPPTGQGWIQTSTIEGTKVIDAWVKANEPPRFVEVGPAGYHVFIGFVKQFNDLPLGGTGSINGKVVYNHFSRPPAVQGYFSGPPVANAWVGLNDPFSMQGIYTAPCNPETGEFTISNVPAGTYELVTWDENLISIFGFNTVVVPPGVSGTGEAVALGDILTFRWFGTLKGSVFYDTDEDGFRDEDETYGMPNRNINLRFRTGEIYQTAPTDPFGNYEFEEVFPFFKWLIAEVDFADNRDTGMTAIVDAGGEIPPDDGWTTPSRDVLNPQEQIDMDPASPTYGSPIINPNTGNALSRTQVATTPGEVLLQAMHLFLTQTNIIDWGKHVYDGIVNPALNGGITGIVYYAVTRAEEDPAQAVGEGWEPGIPRVQVALYEYEPNPDLTGVPPELVTRYYIKDLDTNAGPTLADVDNYPLGWADGSANRGPEDVDQDDLAHTLVSDAAAVFNPGDAVQIVWTDSFDDSLPTGSIGPSVNIHGTTVPPGYDNFGTWNQVRPGVFDGGYSIQTYHPGGMSSGSPEAPIPSETYIVAVSVPPGYTLLKEEDKNVDFGEEPGPSPQTPPPPCVGDGHTVPQYLSFQTYDNGTPLPGIDPGDLIAAPWAGEMRYLSDRKQVEVTNGKNAAADFFLFTKAPVAARAVGFINNDFAPEFDTTSPIFGEKSAPSWLPISFQDWKGNEVARVYCDEYGAYNAMLPSTYWVSVPAPSGVSPQMLTFVINHPGPIPDPVNLGQKIIDPFFDPEFSQSPFTFQFLPGSTTYLDTPVVPVAAFVGYPNRKLDIEPPTLTPMIKSVESPDGGPVVMTDGATITITSVGLRDVPNPAYSPSATPPDPAANATVQRNFGFGGTEGTVTVGGIALDPADVTWGDTTITATIHFASVSTGTLHVKRADNGRSTGLGVTLYVNPSAPVVHVSGGSFFPNTPIQDAIDTAGNGSLIVIAPGTYWENPIVYKPVTLVGSGAESTFINAMPVPSEKVSAWDAKINQLFAGGQIPTDAELFVATQPVGILVYANPGVLTSGSSVTIENLHVTGASAGGGIYVAGNGDYLEICNNRIQSNQGTFGGGITIGQQEAGVTGNQHVKIHHNWILKNGGITGGGGVTINDGSTDYQITDNLIMGCFTSFSGAGVSHTGLSNGGLIAHNQIVFNEVFYGGQIGGDGGGIFISSTFNPNAPPQLTEGAGSVTINANWIQGNIAGSGFGGGICAFGVNGQDVADNTGDPTQWHALNIFNNMIINNVAANAAGGIFLFDTARARIISNTVANNDSTATAANAFSAGNLATSNPQPAGIVGALHSPILELYSGQQYSNPVLADDIVYGNRSWYWDASLNANAGGLVANVNDPVWDLAVLNPLAPTQVLNPDNCLLTSLTDSMGNNYADGTNTPGNPAFVASYYNTLVTAAVLDEGGNFITVRFNEIDRAGDYHIMSTSNAVEAGSGAYVSTYPELQSDYDGDDRMYVTLAPVDIGADQVAPISSTFSTGPEGFTYVDDPFGTAQPDYARGSWSNGLAALVVQVGNVNNNLITGMSGGWRRTFNTREAVSMTLTLDYWFTMQSSYDDGEFSQVLVSIDGGAPVEVYREDATNGGGPTVPHADVYTSAIALSAGQHTITIGLYNNQKDANNEYTQLRINSVKLTQ